MRLLPILLLTSCAMAWNLGNRGEFQSDLDAVVSQHGAKMTQADCNMIGTTRAATCVWSGTEADRNAIEQGLGLELADGGGERGGCRSLEGFGGAVELHVSPKSVPVPGKGAVSFSEFRLFQAAGSRKICVEAQYAAG